MQIKQLANKKVQFWEAGYIQFSCLPGQNYKVINQSEIQVLTIGQKPFSLFAKDIDFTAILGGVLTAVSFADSQELAEYLDLNFFFELSAGGDGGNIFDNFGSLGNYYQSQSFRGSTILPSSIHIATFQFAIPIYLGGSYNEFSMIKLISAFTGLMNYALYDSRTGAGVPGYPNDKIFQSSEIALGTPQQLVQTLLSPSLVLAPGIYWFSWAANGAFRWSGLGELGLLGYSITGSTLSIPQRIFSTVPYASTLPTTWTATINSALSGTPPLLLQIKDIL